MSQVNWLDLLGWNRGHLEDLRFAGFSYIKQGKYMDALKFFEALVVLSKNNLYDLHTLGALYLETGNHLSALDCLERALKIEGSHEPTLLNRAKALFLLGYKKQALAQSSKLEKSTNSAIANQARALTLAYS